MKWLSAAQAHALRLLATPGHGEASPRAKTLEALHRRGLVASDHPNPPLTLKGIEALRLLGLNELADAAAKRLVPLPP